MAMVAVLSGPAGMQRRWAEEEGDTVRGEERRMGPLLPATP